MEQVWWCVVVVACVVLSDVPCRGVVMRCGTSCVVVVLPMNIKCLCNSPEHPLGPGNRAFYDTQPWEAPHQGETLNCISIPIHSTNT